MPETPVIQLNLSPEETLVLLGTFLDSTAQQAQSGIGKLLAHTIECVVPAEYYASIDSASQLSIKSVLALRAALSHFKGQDALKDAGIDGILTLLNDPLGDEADVG